MVADIEGNNKEVAVKCGGLVVAVECILIVVGSLSLVWEPRPFQGAFVSFHLAGKTLWSLAPAFRLVW